jgi:hypothetical protein
MGMSCITKTRTIHECFIDVGVDYLLLLSSLFTAVGDIDISSLPYNATYERQQEHQHSATTAATHHTTNT